MASLELLPEAIVFGGLLGCFYAAVSIGLSVSFGLLDVPHVAHPALMVFGSYCTYFLARFGIDPIVAGVVLMPPFFVLGLLIYRFYHETFEKRGSEAGVRGLAFFFGVAFIIEVALTLTFGVDQRMVETSYIGRSLELGGVRLPISKAETVTFETPRASAVMPRLTAPKRTGRIRPITAASRPSLPFESILLLRHREDLRGMSRCAAAFNIASWASESLMDMGRPFVS